MLDRLRVEHEIVPRLFADQPVERAAPFDYRQGIEAAWRWAPPERRVAKDPMEAVREITSLDDRRWLSQRRTPPKCIATLASMQIGQRVDEGVVAGSREIDWVDKPDSPGKGPDRVDAVLKRAAAGLGRQEVAFPRGDVTIETLATQPRDRASKLAVCSSDTKAKQPEP